MGGGAHGGRGDAQGDVVRVHLTVHGLVQGVGYRYFAYQSAIETDVTGWVRNLWSGDVEAEAQGTRAAVAAFVSRLKVGPKWGHVDGVDAELIRVERGESSFRVRN
ncbi:acylphosphatase [Bifidobacterium sp. CP2]|uniref:acylphosphatase n=1 Tax=Bifidobacterium sp. CP2 TaxID=2809025 RepID=UPI001BDCC490|nr:acylphosphatase [Bifidobacterium sp. CP2]MBT1181465.1 acylphosphatase [Bifidobacterium sp. CP2]